MKEDYMKKQKKTNVMRILDAHEIHYVPHFNIDVDDAAGRERLEHQGNVFKTLVTQGKTNELYVFVVPYADHLDLKKAAATVKEKSLQMIPQKDLLKHTGYMHGGCSPIGMKKEFKTVIHESAKEFKMIAISGGKVGTQVEVASSDIKKVIDTEYYDIIA